MKGGLIRATGSVMVAVLVALPLSSWAAACRPIFVGAAVMSSRRQKPAAPVYRRVRRHRRRLIARAGKAARAFSMGAAVPDDSQVLGPLGRSVVSSVTDLPPPDLPPA